MGDLWWERHAAQRRHSQKIKGEVGLKRPPTVGSDKGDPPLDNWWTVHKTVGQEEVENIVPSQVFVHTLFSSMISKKSFESLWWDVVWWFSAATILQYHIKWVYYQLYSLKQNFLVFRTEGNLIQESNVTQIAPFGTFRAWLSADSAAVHPNRLSHPWHCLLYLRIKSWTCLRWHSLTAGSTWGEGRTPKPARSKAPLRSNNNNGRISQEKGCARHSIWMLFDRSASVTGRAEYFVNTGHVNNWMQRMCTKKGGESQLAVG